MERWKWVIGRVYIPSVLVDYLQSCITLFAFCLDAVQYGKKGTLLAIWAPGVLLRRGIDA